jgi:two-component system, cell cycle sensor histidine kinase and response regulator CckA
MAFVSMKRPIPLTIASSILFLVGFGVLTILVPGGELFGSFMVIPLSLIAWGWGSRMGLIAAIAGTAYTEAIFSLEYLLVRHNPVSLYWFLIVVSPTVFIFLGLVVGRLGDTLRELSTALEARKAAEDAQRLAEGRYKDLFDFAPEAISVIQDGRPMLVNRKALQRTGYSEDELKNGAEDFLPPEERQKSDDFQRKVLAGTADEQKVTTRYVARNGRNRWIEVTGKRITWNAKPAGLYFSVDVTERKEAEMALGESHAHLEALLNALPDLMMELDRQGRVLDCRSSRPEQLLALHPAPPSGRTVGELLPPDAAEAVMDALAKAAEKGEYRSPPLKLVGGGKTRWSELSIAAVGDRQDPGCHFIALERDVTERRNLEEQVVQSQKMEAVGRLAGGIAHDFNNILMVILGFCDLIKASPEDHDEVRKDIGVIKDSAEKAAALTRQLLAFSRKQMTQSRAEDLNILLRRSEEILRRVLGEDIILSVETGTAPSAVKVDAGQFQQVIMNLAVNARDAMPGGGRLSIECHNTVLGPDTASIPSEIAPGAYAAITVRDTGQGMDKETLSRIFEPFFTTKEVGKGTGLGLSIVYGIVRQLDGFVTVDSRPGRGTTFRVHLPLTRDAPKDALPASPRAPVGTETVLLVEDDDAVRRLISRSLRAWGYAVVEARDGAEALHACRDGETSIDVLLTDLVMPGMRGEQVARDVRGLFPNVRVLEMTGYTDRPDDPAGVPSAAEEERRILHKPFDLADLRTLIREALDKPRP